MLLENVTWVNASSIVLKVVGYYFEKVAGFNIKKKLHKPSRASYRNFY